MRRTSRPFWKIFGRCCGRRCGLSSPFTAIFGDHSSVSLPRWDCGPRLPKRTGSLRRTREIFFCSRAMNWCARIVNYSSQPIFQCSVTSLTVSWHHCRDFVFSTCSTSWWLALSASPTQTRAPPLLFLSSCLLKMKQETLRPQSCGPRPWGRMTN